MDVAAFFILCGLLVEIAGSECEWYVGLCESHKNCDACINAHHCCFYCPNPKNNTPTCTTEARLSCPPDEIVPNQPTTQTDDLRTTSDPFNQITPERIQVTLHRHPFNISFRYKAAKNYPVDIYYISDVTHTMEDSIKQLSNLADDLTNTLSNISTNYKIALGSYVDKTLLPFYPTKKFFDNPCGMYNENCTKGFLFKHLLNFTDVNHFSATLRELPYSGNLDDLEAGLAALMQVLLCQEAIDWRPNARKLVLFVSGSYMHWAGDGILAGALKRNRYECLIDSSGRYTADDSVYDYPSLEELYYALQEKRTSVVIAAKENVWEYYKEMSALMPSNVFVGKLSDTSEIFELIKKGYLSLAQTVDFFVNRTANNAIHVKFYAKCDGVNWVRGGHCENVGDDEEILFKAELQLDAAFDKEELYFKIEEKHLTEAINVHVKFVNSKCKCNTLTSNLVCKNGKRDCDKCICWDNWTGELCDQQCPDEIQNCIPPGSDQRICHQNGQCICNQCECYPQYRGQYCQYECPVDATSHLICNGHGECAQTSNDTISYRCYCDAEFTGDTCSCSTHTDDCTLNNVECSHFGRCECNKCLCEPDFSGKFCQHFDKHDAICQKYERCILDAVNKNLNCSIPIEFVSSLNHSIQFQCVAKVENNTEYCGVIFSYDLRSHEPVKFDVLREECGKTASATLISGIIVVVTVLLGLAIIGIIKARNMYMDKIEYQRFQKEVQMFKMRSNINPEYKDPTRSYQVPQSAKFD